MVHTIHVSENMCNKIHGGCATSSHGDFVALAFLDSNESQIQCSELRITGSPYENMYDSELHMLRRFVTSVSIAGMFFSLSLCSSNA